MEVCEGPYNGSDAKLAFAEEQHCGKIPDNTVVSKWSNFGLVSKITPHYKFEKDSLKVVGRRGISAQRRKSVEAGIDVDYNPTVASLYTILRFGFGVDNTSGEPDGKWHDYAPTRSEELYTWNELPAGTEYRSFFFINSVLDELTIEINAGELITVTEKMKSLDMLTKTGEQNPRTDPDGNSLGDWPNDIDPMKDEPLSAEDCDIYVAHHQADDFTAASGNTTFTLTKTAEDLDADSDYKDSIEVYVNGVMISDADYTYDSSNNSVNIPSVSDGDTIEVIYYYRELVSEYSKVTLTFTRGAVIRKGIIRGKKSGYTVRPVTKVLKASITKDYNTSAELERMINDEYIHFFVVIGNKEFRMLFGKWDGELPPYEPETLLEHSLESEFNDVVVVDV